MITFVFDYEKSRDMGIVKSDYLNNLREHFSVEDPIANIKKLKYGNFVPSRHYAITQAGRFKVGMFAEIANYVRGLGIPYKIIVTELLKERFFCGYNIDKIKKLGKEIRDYQEDAVLKALAQGNGVIVSATASGKTFMMATLIESIRTNSKKSHKTIVVVPGIQLVEQTYDDFVEYGIDNRIISKWSGDHGYDPTSKIVIASLSILQSKSTDLNVLKKYDLFIADEVHKFRRGNKANDLLKYVETKNRYGFTGTMPEGKIDQWNIIGLFGPVLMEKTSKDLRDNDYITDASVQVIKLKYKNPLVYKNRSTFLDPTAKYNEECEFIYNQPYRNKVISKIANNTDKNILILVDKIEQGETLVNAINKYAKDKTVYFIRGSVEVDERENIRKLMEERDNIICVAITSIFSTGINIKNLHYILFAAAGKAKIKIIQSIGRGLRLHENKEHLIIFDICDSLEYSNKHLSKRLSLYNKERIKYAIKEINEK